jgi:hypothetical protein
VLLNIKRAFPKLVREVNLIRFREEHRSYEWVAEAVLLDDSVLRIKDYLFLDGSRKYAYHWQAADSSMIARWDNAAHWPSISTFPHHVHEAGSDQPSESAVRSVADALSLIEKKISR